jgi:hypothetical protein
VCQIELLCARPRQGPSEVAGDPGRPVAIGKGLKALHVKAEELGGKTTYDRLREREGLAKDIIRKSRSSRLIAIIDNLPAVEAWRADDLDDKQRFDWASPEAVHRHCPEPKPALERAFERLIKESEKATSDEKAHATPLWESLASVWAPAKNKTKKAA